MANDSQDDLVHNLEHDTRSQQSFSGFYNIDHREY